MTVRNLEFLFRPKSVAVVAEPEEQSHYAEIVRGNLETGGFAGPVVAVAVSQRSRFKLGSRIRLEPTDGVLDLAVICARLEHIPEIIAELGERGTRAVIIGPSLREKESNGDAAALRKAILAAARPRLIRVLGPGSGGFMVPALGLNASVSPIAALPGKIALITQSTAVATAVVDRAASKGIGFSAVIHLGAGIDIDLADVLDWLAEDPGTERILVQFDSIAVGRKFMSAARAAARNKPVVAIRGDRAGSGRPGGARFGSDDVYEAALRRAGWVRIATLGDAFEAAEAMARLKPMSGERLTILANGHGLGRMAADALLLKGGHLATLEKETVQQLAGVLQTKASLGNPLALPLAIRPSGWAEALAAVLADRNTDAVMTVCSPSPFAPGAEVADEISSLAKESGRNVFSCWVGGASMVVAQQIAAAHGVMSHDSPEKAVAVFLGLVNYYRNRELLMQMPPSLPDGYVTDIKAAHSAVSEALAAGANELTARQARRLLQAYGIEAAEYSVAGSVDAAIDAANAIGYPVDLGLVLANAVPFAPLSTGLHSPADIQMAVRGLRKTVRTLCPGIRVSGYRLRRSAARSGAAPLCIGVSEDPVFGPVIFLGPSSVAGGREGRFVVGMPPLNLALARDLVARSSFAADAPGEDRAALEDAASNALVRLSQLLTDVDEVVGIELDPLHVETTGVIALGARIRIEQRVRKLGLRRFAIRPYPKELERQVDWDGHKLLIRPIRPEDENTLGDLLHSLAPEDSCMRFFATMRQLPRSQLARFTQIDYDREMSLVAIERGSDGKERSLGEVRVVADPDNEVAEFAVVVSSTLKGKGLGRLLMQEIIDYARVRGIGTLHGETLADNQRMQHLAQLFGFVVHSGSDPGTVDLSLVLRPAAGEGRSKP